MGSFMVVVFSPGTNNLSRVIEIVEPMLIEAAITEPCVEAFNKRILGWLTRLNKLKFDTGSF